MHAHGMASKTLDIRRVTASSFLSDYKPQNVLVNNPLDHSSRWVGAYKTGGSRTKEWLMLELALPAVVKTIKFGKFRAKHPCNIERFKVYGALNATDEMTELLYGTLKDDAISQTFSLIHRNQQGVVFPCRFVKIEPLTPVTPTFNMAIWHVSLAGTDDPQIVRNISSKLTNHRESVTLRLILKHLRQKGHGPAYNALLAELGGASSESLPSSLPEHPLVSSLFDAVVKCGNYTEAEKIFEKAVGPEFGLADHYVSRAEPEVYWRQFSQGTLTGSTPSKRAGHTSVFDPNSNMLYLHGGFNGVHELSDFWAFDIASEKWTCLIPDVLSSTLPLPSSSTSNAAPGRRSCGTMALDELTGDIYIWGRYVEPPSAEAEVEPTNFRSVRSRASSRPVSRAPVEPTMSRETAQHRRVADATLPSRLDQISDPSGARLTLLRSIPPVNVEETGSLSLGHQDQEMEVDPTNDNAARAAYAHALLTSGPTSSASTIANPTTDPLRDTLAALEAQSTSQIPVTDQMLTEFASGLQGGGPGGPRTSETVASPHPDAPSTSHHDSQGTATPPAIPPSHSKSDFWRYSTRGTDAGKWNLISMDTTADGGPELAQDAAMTIDGEAQILYVFGGEIVTCIRAPDRYNGLFAYDIEKREWTKLLDDLPSSKEITSQSRDKQNQIVSRSGHSLVLDSVGKKLYIVGGQRGDASLDSVFTYDIETGEIVEVTFADYASHPSALELIRVVGDPSTRELFAVSGLSHSGSSSMSRPISHPRSSSSQTPLWIYSMDTSLWTAIRYPTSSIGPADTPPNTDAPQPRLGHSVAYDPGRRIFYSFGGRKLIDRLDDFWSLSLVRPSVHDIARKAKISLRCQHFVEMCDRGETLTALQYLQTNISSLVRPDDETENAFVRSLLSRFLSRPSTPTSLSPSSATTPTNGAVHVEDPTSQPSDAKRARLDENGIMDGDKNIEERDDQLHAQRTALFDDLLRYINPDAKLPAGNLVDLVGAAY